MKKALATLLVVLFWPVMLVAVGVMLTAGMLVGLASSIHELWRGQPRLPVPPKHKETP